MGNWRDSAKILTYSQLQLHRDELRSRAIQQGLAMWASCIEYEQHTQDGFKWGEEVEYLLLTTSTSSIESKANGVAYRQSEVLKDLSDTQNSANQKRQTEQR